MQGQNSRRTARAKKRTAVIGFRVERTVKRAAERAAARDRRTLSSLLENILIEFLRAQGDLRRDA
jgi:hypothetical protein